MLKQHRIGNVLPGIKTIDEGIDIYSKFYSEPNVLKYGVLAIKLVVLK
jgi:ASC-1-like (ASCH) protein